MARTIADSRGGRLRQFLLLALIFLLASCVRTSPPVRLVLITLDTLRYDSFAGSDGTPSAMPLMLARASRGVRFDRFYAATSTTQPSHASIFTGLHPWKHGVTRNGLVLGEEHETVAEIARQAGFETAAVIASFPVSRTFGFAQGFDWFDDRFTHRFSEQVWEGVSVGAKGFYALADTVTDEAIERLNDFKHPRQFLWVHYFDPHAPYGDSTHEPALTPESILAKAVRRDPSAAEEVVRARRLYDADVGFMDRQLDRLFRRLDEDTSRFETHVVVLADHGESLGEGGSLGHGKRLSPEVLHVPCFVLSPKLAPVVRHDVAGSIDIAPTLLSLAGVSHSLPGGRDLLAPPSKTAGAFGMRRTFVTPFQEPRLDGTIHVVDFNLFFVVEPDGTLYTGNSRLVRKGEAPDGESVGADRASALLALFHAFEERLAAGTAVETMDPEARKALEALGYAR